MAACGRQFPVSGRRFPWRRVSAAKRGWRLAIPPGLVATVDWVRRLFGDGGKDADRLGFADGTGGGEGDDEASVGGEKGVLDE